MDLLGIEPRSTAPSWRNPGRIERSRNHPLNHKPYLLGVSLALERLSYVVLSICHEKQDVEP